MEIGKSQIARLVLGYLRSEKCNSAFDEFLTSCQYLKQHAPFVKNGKYFSTRVGGLTLEEIITEYSEISILIEGKLEQTNYYEEHHKMSLVNQLMYIFDNYCQPQPVTAVLSKTLHATPREFLPGNKPSKDISKESNVSETSAFEGVCPIDHGNISQISQTLLDKSELHEKLADAINSVCKVSNSQDIVGESSFAELDNKIKTIVQKAEQDPIFDQILEEIIGTNVPSGNSENTYQYNSNGLNTSISSTSSKNQSNESPKRIEKSTEDAVQLTASSTPKENSDVIIFNGNLDSYVGKTGPIVTPSQQSQIFVASSSPGVLMLPPMIAAPNYFIVNNQPPSDDIMKMPTIILNEGSSKIKELSPQKARKCKTLAPRCDNITVSTQSGDYLAVYKDDGEVEIENDKVEVQKKKNNKTAQGIGVRKRLPRQAKMKSENDQQSKKPNVDTKIDSTPKSGSHVRTLDFTSPPKDAEPKPTEKKLSPNRKVSHESKKVAKNDKKIKKTTWDADLRELLIPKNTPLISPDTSGDMLNMTCEDDAELKKNAKLIEAAFVSPIKTPHKTVAEKAEITVIENNEVDKKIIEEETKITTLVSNSTKEVNEKNTVEKLHVEQTEVYLRNCNAPQRFKKKCNISNNTVQKYDVEVVIETEEETEVIEIEESQNNDVLSMVKRDLVLETPTKLPKTPGKSELTPFSRVLEEHLQGIDILTLPTPNLPLTPCYPITPTITLSSSSHINRPTDYSTSSSYYQPSDTEQNKSLEHMIEECKKLERRDVELRNRCQNEENHVPTGTVTSNYNEIKRVFNENVIGKKNLNLIKSRNSSSDDSNSFSSRSSDSSDSDSENDAGIPAGEGTYCLRKRISTPTTGKAKASTKKPLTKNSPDASNELNVSKNKVASQKTSQMRLRTSKPSKKPIVKKKPRTILEKQIKTNEPISKILEADNEITDEDITLHLSTDEETVKSSAEILKTKELNLDKTETPSDLEAEQLVQGLKERGIHLVHKKSPKKSQDEPGNVPKNQDDMPSRPDVNTIISKHEELENGKNEVEILTCQNPHSVPEADRSDLEITFDVQEFVEPHFEFSYNYNKKKAKKRIVDSSVLLKKIEATVYIESLDEDVERIIECTPFQSVFDYIPNKSKKSTSVDCSKRKSSVESPSKVNKKSVNNKKSTKSETKTHKQEGSNKIPEKDTTAKDVKKTDDMKCERVEHKSTVQPETNECVDGGEQRMNSCDDDLMNYAIMGSQREENLESPRSGNKRKRSFTEDEEFGDKKCKTEQQHALLKKINVDMFLNKVHGNVEKS